MKAVITSLLVIASVQSFASQELTVGDKAPALKVANWVKGKPVNLGKGRYTVVEFWATWCGPCKQSIPHLTDMANAYKGKVNFVGVSVWESKPIDYTTKVPAFVKEMGSKMDYNVATDTSDQHMAKQWLQAAGENGIPSAFLIDPKGTVVWIGHPMDGLDKAIDANLSGKFDLQAAIKARKDAKEEQAKQMKMMEEFQKNFAKIVEGQRAKKWDVVLAEAEKLEKEKPETAIYCINFRLSAMIETNNPGLGSYLTSLMSKPELDQSPDFMNQLAWMVVEKDLKLNNAAYEAACKLAAKAVQKDLSNGMNMDTLALAHWRCGNKAQALEVQKKAVELVTKDKSVPAETLQEMKNRLKEYGG
jgi:thiol-disulfide isomerase/thioredoxin